VEHAPNRAADVCLWIWRSKSGFGALRAAKEVLEPGAEGAVLLEENQTQEVKELTRELLVARISQQIPPTCPPVCPA
jgi:hypothetical protein